MLIARYTVFLVVICLTAICAALSLVSLFWLLPAAAFLALSLLGVRDVLQTRSAIIHNYPVVGHVRFLFETFRPEIRQYLLEGDRDEEPFSREMRSLVYQRAKGEEDKRPFGTTQKVYESGYAWLTHSIAAKHIPDKDFRTTIGGPECTQPYEASLYNISAMSFGSLSANAISALNRGARKGGFAHDTGEGGISRYHKLGCGDLIYQVASGYFGCRNEDGSFSNERFAEQARNPQVKMIEIKLSQGAKPGHGGMLPAPKITPEIAEARGIPMGIDCVSPPAHSAFSTPIEMMNFVARLRDLSGGKPVGIKLCIGHRREFLCIVKAMLVTGTVPDFIVVDGKEGGTGAAPLEFANRVGMPMMEGLTFVHNALRGAGIREQVRMMQTYKREMRREYAELIAQSPEVSEDARDALTERFERFVQEQSEKRQVFSDIENTQRKAFEDHQSADLSSFAAHQAQSVSDMREQVEAEIRSYEDFQNHQVHVYTQALEEGFEERMEKLTQAVADLETIRGL